MSFDELMGGAPHTIPNPHHVLRAHGLKAKKALGQNFLSDISVVEQIAQSGGLTPSSVTFEIGAGCGTLTHALAARAGRVIALEYDNDLISIVRSELAYAPHVEVRHGDVREFDWGALSQEVSEPLIVYGNLPYYLSSDILLALLEGELNWSRACFMVQLEFAERVCAHPGNRKAGSISALTHLLTYPTVLFKVPPEAFSPAPKVESAVMVLERRATPAFDVGDPRVFRSVVRALFSQRRKMARRSLKPLCDDPEALLVSCGLNPEERGERFSLEQLADLSRALITWRATQGAHKAQEGEGQAAGSAEGEES